MTVSDSSLRIAALQMNARVGALEANVAQITAALAEAKAAGADVLLTPELALCGYPPEDLLLRQDFLLACEQALAQVQAATEGITLVIGHPQRDGGELFNAASVLRDGQLVARYYKQRLPNYQVFDESRYFVAGTQPCVFTLNGVKLGVSICADIWDTGAAERAHQAGAEALLVLNASPYHQGKQAERYATLRSRIRTTGMAVLYANLIGGQDELVFDGASFALNADGGLAWQADWFTPALQVLDYQAGQWLGGALVEAPCVEEQVYRALVMGVRDYVGKNGFPSALIGLSGGIDSALTLCIAVDALGADKVRAVMMASPYTAQMSLDDSRALVKNLGVRYDEIPIEPAMTTFESMLSEQFAGLPADTTEENLQSRIRGVMLMAISNKTGAIVLTTGNKSEMATGYATLYGDMAGGFAVIKDVYKTLVYRISRWINREQEIIPDNIITRPPSAELKPDQCDQDSLPEYEVLDAIIQGYMERNASVAELVAEGLPEQEIRRTIGMIKRNEYKRRQAPPGVRVTVRAYGKDWRYPITSGYWPK